MPTAVAVQSALAPAGPHAASIHLLWSLMLWVSVAVFIAVIGFLVIAVAKGLTRRTTESHPSPSDNELSRSVGAAVVGTVVVLLVLLVASVGTGRSIASLHASSSVTILVTGHQWWWEIEYEEGVASRRALTANEVHIPVGRPVVFKVTSRDVIHSFWVPNLQGKRDLIPGYTTAIWMQADRPGTFRGQCAEFCGLQHAHMALDVVAESEGDFERWLNGVRDAAREPSTEEERHGREVFMTARCGSCHTVRGTDAHGQVAPDLTHIATRHTLGAGTLPNSHDHMRRWIEDPQASKPGNQMPPNPLAPADREMLLAYLASLQ